MRYNFEVKKRELFYQTPIDRVSTFCGCLGYELLEQPNNDNEINHKINFGDNDKVYYLSTNLELYEKVNNIKYSKEDTKLLVTELQYKYDYYCESISFEFAVYDKHSDKPVFKSYAEATTIEEIANDIYESLKGKYYFIEYTSERFIDILKERLTKIK